jgi:carboxypeptidase Taq
LSAQFFDAAMKAHPGITAEMQRGAFGTLHGWLRDNIYRHGRIFTATELVERVTGGPLHVEPYIRYLREKYGELYTLDA